MLLDHPISFVRCFVYFVVGFVELLLKVESLSPPHLYLLTTFTLTRLLPSIIFSLFFSIPPLLRFSSPFILSPPPHHLTFSLPTIPHFCSYFSPPFSAPFFSLHPPPFSLHSSAQKRIKPYRGGRSSIRRRKRERKWKRKRFRRRFRSDQQPSWRFLRRFRFPHLGRMG